jgi:hypothetical protein
MSLCPPPQPATAMTAATTIDAALARFTRSSSLLAS